MAKTKDPGLPLAPAESKSVNNKSSLLWKLVNALSLRPGSSNGSSAPTSEKGDTKRTSSGVENSKIVESPPRNVEIAKDSYVESGIFDTKGQPRSLAHQIKLQESIQQSGLSKELLQSPPATTPVSTERRTLRRRRSGDEKENELPQTTGVPIDRQQTARTSSLLQNTRRKKGGKTQIQTEIRRTRQNSSVDDATFGELILTGHTRRKRTGIPIKQKTIGTMGASSESLGTNSVRSLISDHFKETLTPVKGPIKVESETSFIAGETTKPNGKSVQVTLWDAKLPEVSSVVAPRSSDILEMIELKGGLYVKGKTRIPISLLVNESDFIDKPNVEKEQKKLLITDTVGIEESLEEKESSAKILKEEKECSTEISEEEMESSAEIPEEEKPSEEAKVEHQEESQKEPSEPDHTKSPQIPDNFLKKTESRGDESPSNTTGKVPRRRKRRFKRYEKSNRRVIINPSSESEASVSSLLDIDSASQQVEVVANGSVDYTDYERLMIDELVRDQTALEARSEIEVIADEVEASAQPVETNKMKDISGDNKHPNEITSNHVSAGHVDSDLDVPEVIGELLVERTIDDRRTSKRRKLNQKRKSEARKLFRAQRNTITNDKPMDREDSVPKSVTKDIAKVGIAAGNRTDIGEVDTGAPTRQVREIKIGSSPRRDSTAIEMSKPNIDNNSQTTEEKLFVSSLVLDALVADSHNSTDVPRLQVANSQESPPHRIFDADSLRAAFGLPTATLTQTNHSHFDFSHPQTNQIQSMWQRSTNPNNLPTHSKLSKTRRHRIRIIPYPKEEEPPQQPLKTLAEQMRERFQQAGNVYLGFVDQTYESD